MAALTLLVALSAGIASLAYSPDPAALGNAAAPTPIAADLPSLGLMTSLPIYWPEAVSIDELLAAGPDETPHWVRTMLEQDYVLVPLNTLHGNLGEGGGQPIPADLARLDMLLLAQPYALSPQDNVALDSWVRAGGKLLMFADPMLTEHSRFGIGDRRRPQDVGLIPAVFARWGLSQNFDEAQPATEVSVEVDGTAIPVNQRGIFSAVSPKPADSGDNCTVGPAGLLAECSVGRGRALIVGDAALLEDDRSPERETALRFLLTSSLQ